MGLPFEVRVSQRRRRTIGWQIRAGTLIITLPGGLSATERDRWIATIRDKADARYERAARATDRDLLARARALAREYFPGVEVRAARWMRARTRYGSCSPDTAAIRLNERLKAMPGWVLDYVIVHEVAHLLEPNHSDRFWALVNRYPLAERARGFLLGLEFREAHPDVGPLRDGEDGLDGDEEEGESVAG